MPGHSYKGSTVKSQDVLATEAPVASKLTANKMQWVFPYPNPQAWGLFTVGNIIPGNQVQVTNIATTRIFAGIVTAGSYVVAGMNTTHTQITTLVSNQVALP